MTVVTAPRRWIMHPQPRTPSTSLYPLRFEPFLRPMVWGGRRLALLGKSLPGADAYGEAWDLSDHASHHSVVANGPRAGQTLRLLMEQERPALLGPAAGRHATFPWLVKFLDAADWLSVQVHPDEQCVGKLWPGEGPKTEAWFVLDAAPGSKIYAGLLPGVDEARLRAALANGTVADCLHQFAPRPGDCVFLPAGTVHAVGGGVLMAEVQQTSDATFRLFDWNRVDAQGKSRKLHLEEAMASIHWDLGPIQPIRAEGFRLGTPLPGTPAVRQELVHCPFFRLEYIQNAAPFTCGGVGALQILVVLNGQGSWDGGEEVGLGQVWLLPAGLEKTWVRPRAGLGCLLCTLPPA